MCTQIFISYESVMNETVDVPVLDFRIGIDGTDMCHVFLEVRKGLRLRSEHA